MFRITLFLVTNLAIIFVLNIVLSIFGLESWMQQNGMEFNVQGTLIIAFLFGMGGAFISLALSKPMAKKSMQVRIIEQPANANEQWLWDTVKKQSEQAGIKMPELGIFPLQQPNAFATGMFRNSALVAVSAGLLNSMGRDEVEAVLGHEISHVANGDMVTLALVQGIVNTFVIFLARALGHMIDRVVFKGRGYGPGYWITVIVLQIIFSILASMIVLWFSRYREFRADQGGAKLAGRDKMIRALQCLQSMSTADLPDRKLAAFGIHGSVSKQKIKSLFSSHPPLSERIRALQNLHD